VRSYRRARRRPEAALPAEVLDIIVFMLLRVIAGIHVSIF
jgi:hypothetical protein